MSLTGQLPAAAFQPVCPGSGVKIGESIVDHDRGVSRLSDPRPRSRVPRRQLEKYLGVELRQVRLTLERRPILRGIDWRIRPGERWILTGENGAGKTLLLKLLAGDIWPTADAGARRYR